ncbi:MAG: nucleotidyltransferase family protein [Novosphingobium sp.]
MGAGYFRLSSDERQLLLAATQRQPVARQAWEQWIADNRLETAGLSSQALFGPLYANIPADLSVSDTTILRGVYKRTWYANQVALSRIQPLLARMAAAAVPAVLLYDACLALGYYADVGHRPINCVDISVPASAWNTSIDAAIDDGWQAREDKSFVSASSLSCMVFAGPMDASLRIWVNLFIARPQEATEAQVLRETRPVEFKGQSISILGPVEQLLCLSADVFRADKLRLSSCVDAYVLARSIGSETDWNRLVAQAQRFEHILPLRNILSFLETELALELPAWVLPELRRMAISHGELIRYRQACETLPLKIKAACRRWLGPMFTGAARG